VSGNLKVLAAPGFAGGFEFGDKACVTANPRQSRGLSIEFPDTLK
jgi:hypothetical protein